MQISKIGIDLIKKFEQCRLNAYLDSVKVPTIGWGNTYYEDGTRVKMGDSITQQRADELFTTTVNKFSNKVSSLLNRKDIDQNKFDAIVCFTYNVGTKALETSTLLRKVNKDPNDPTIRNEFLRWIRAGGKVLNGLVRRREEEAKLYFS